MDHPAVHQGDPPWWRLALWWLASVVVAVLHNGLWATPNLAFVSLIARRPGENPFGAGLEGDYLLTDQSLTNLAHLLGRTAPHEIARLHLVVLVLAWAAVAVLARYRFGHPTARALTVLIAASPVVTVSMQWLGQPDPLTAMCGIAMVLVRRRSAVVALAVLAGLTHPEQAVFMAAVAGTVRAVLPDRSPVPRTRPLGESLQASPSGTRWRSGILELVLAVGGVGLGRLLTQSWFWLHDIVIHTPRTQFLDYGLSGFADHHSQHALGLLWTLWGPLWLAMLAVGTWAILRRREVSAWFAGQRVAWLTMGILALAAVVPVALTLDETRVYAVITAPLLGGSAILLGAGLPDRLAARSAVLLLALTAVIPGGFATGVTSWRGQLDTPAMVRFLGDGSIPDPAQWRGGDAGIGAERSAGEGRDGLLTAWLLSPFDFVIPAPPD